MRGFPSHATQREIAAIEAARILRPWTPALTLIAAGLLVLSAALFVSAVAAADRAIEIAERV